MLSSIVNPLLPHATGAELFATIIVVSALLWLIWPRGDHRK